MSPKIFQLMPHYKTAVLRTYKTKHTKTEREEKRNGERCFTSSFTGYYSCAVLIFRTSKVNCAYTNIACPSLLPCITLILSELDATLRSNNHIRFHFDILILLTS